MYFWGADLVSHVSVGKVLPASFFFLGALTGFMFKTLAFDLRDLREHALHRRCSRASPPLLQTGVARVPQELHLWKERRRVWEINDTDNMEKHSLQMENEDTHDWHPPQTAKRSCVVAFLSISWRCFCSRASCLWFQCVLETPRHQIWLRSWGMGWHDRLWAKSARWLITYIQLCCYAHHQL